jgi:hypothetical protein
MEVDIIFPHKVHSQIELDVISQGEAIPDGAGKFISLGSQKEVDNVCTQGFDSRWSWLLSSTREPIPDGIE